MSQEQAPVNQHSSTTNQGEEFVQVNGNNYPKRVVEVAQRVIVKTGGSLESAIHSVIVFEEAEREAQIANPNETAHALVVFGHRIEEQTNRLLFTALDKIITELQLDISKKQPTKMEQMIGIFKAKIKAGEVVTIDDLETLFEDTKNPRKGVYDLVSKLSTKLNKYGFQIGSIAGYHITSTTDTKS